MPRVTVKSSPLPRQDQRRAVAGVLMVGAALVLLFLLIRLTSGPTFVSQVTIVNTTPYQLNAEVADAGEAGWLDLGTVPREREKSVEEIADQGDRWTFRFSSGGVDAGELEVPRAELERDEWQVTVPPGFALSLQAAGVPPSAS